MAVEVSDLMSLVADPILQCWHLPGEQDPGRQDRGDLRQLEQCGMLTAASHALAVHAQMAFKRVVVGHMKRSS